MARKIDSTKKIEINYRIGYPVETNNGTLVSDEELAERYIQEKVFWKGIGSIMPAVRSIIALVNDILQPGHRGIVHPGRVPRTHSRKCRIDSRRP